VISVYFVLRYVHETRGKELEQMEGWGALPPLIALAGNKRSLMIQSGSSTASR